MSHLSAGTFIFALISTIGNSFSPTLFPSRPAFELGLSGSSISFGRAHIAASSSGGISGLSSASSARILVESLSPFEPDNLLESGRRKSGKGSDSSV